MKKIKKKTPKLKGKAKAKLAFYENGINVSGSPADLILTICMYLNWMKGKDKNSYAATKGVLENFLERDCDVDNMNTFFENKTKEGLEQILKQVLEQARKHSTEAIEGIEGIEAIEDEENLKVKIKPATA